MEALEQLLQEWERWSAELLESHLSYPMLAHFRSQHDNQSWLGALAAILDTSALLIADLEGPDRHQAKLTFAISRHAAVDLAQVFAIPPLKPTEGRLSANELTELRISFGNGWRAPSRGRWRRGKIDLSAANVRTVYSGAFQVFVVGSSTLAAWTPTQ